MVGGNPGYDGRPHRSERPGVVAAAGSSRTQAPRFPPRAEAGELVTLIDMDHFVEGNFDADPDWVVARAYEMHAPCEVWK